MTFRQRLPVALYSAAETRELDRLAIQEYGIPGYTLMSRAGEFAFKTAQHLWPHCEHMVVLTGKGNNGGDGYVIAALAKRAGIRVQIRYLADPHRLEGDARTAYLAAVAADVEMSPFRGDPLTADLIVDALLGTGLNSEVRDDYVRAIDCINRCQAPCLAIDVPSGLSADTGQVLGAAVRAAATTTFIGCKRGLLTAFGPDYCGEIYFDDLDVPPAVYSKQPANVCRVSESLMRNAFGPRKRTGHKGDHGHLLLVGGDHGMSGAIMMAAEAALRTGAGLVSVATRSEHTGHITSRCPELMCHGVDYAERITPLIEKATAIVIGPGIGRSTWADELAKKVLESRLPMVVDADGLNWLADNHQKEAGNLQDFQNVNWILTPHPGEAGRLLDTSTRSVQQDRFAAAEALQNHYKGTVVLKGAGTIISGAPDDQELPNTRLIAAGNPGMGSGGMGDVLSGVIGALLAQKYSNFEAACLGALAHSTAADMAALEQGERGLLATDLYPYILQIVNGRF